MEFDISESGFVELASRAPAIIVLLAKTGLASCISPLDAYASISGTFSYLLESVEKEKRHARFSFVGSDPDAVVTLKDRKVTIEYNERSELIEFIKESMKKVCDVQEVPGKITGEVQPGYDSLDAIRCAFPTSCGAAYLNRTRFDRQCFLGGGIGFTAYDVIYDAWLDVRTKVSDAPDMQFMLVSKTVLFDHLTDSVYIALSPFVSRSSDPHIVYRNAKSEAEKIERRLSAKRAAPGKSRSDSALSCSMSQDEFQRAVSTAKKHIIDGDIFQVVLSRRCDIRTHLHPAGLYARLRDVNPSPYMYLFNFNGMSIIGASPETLMTVHNRRVAINPIAGTCARGKNDAEDSKFAGEMLSSEKERAEHVMLVDLGRNDVRMVCKPGSVKVSDFMSVLKYSHVQHIESTVTGELRSECDQFDAMRAIFPAGTLSGAPKIRAMEIIDTLEKSARGIYGGGVGYFSWDGDADFAIVIRTIILKDGVASVQAGAGIVADSDPAYEYIETERKMAAMVRAIQGASE